MYKSGERVYALDECVIYSSPECSIVDEDNVVVVAPRDAELVVMADLDRVLHIVYETKRGITVMGYVKEFMTYAKL
jgi:hypothetical protein